MRKLISLVIFSCAVAALAQSPNDGQSWWNYVKVLADDNMEGRETGSAGYDRAAAYVVEQAKADGLQPAGVNGFYQPVKFRSKQIDESQSSLALVRDGKVEPMVLGRRCNVQHSRRSRALGRCAARFRGLWTSCS